MKHCIIIYEVDTYRIHTYLIISIIIHTWHTCVSFVHWLGSDNSEKEKSVQQLLRNLHLVDWIIPFVSLPCDQVWEVINHQRGWLPDTGFPSFRKGHTQQKWMVFGFLFSTSPFRFKDYHISVYNQVTHIYIYAHTHTHTSTQHGTYKNIQVRILLSDFSMLQLPTSVIAEAKWRWCATFKSCLTAGKTWQAPWHRGSLKSCGSTMEVVKWCKMTSFAYYLWVSKMSHVVKSNSNPTSHLLLAGLFAEGLHQSNTNIIHLSVTFRWFELLRSRNANVAKKGVVLTSQSGSKHGLCESLDLSKGWIKHQ